MSKTIFITGSSTGLGRASPLLFAAKGWTVIAAMRNPGKATYAQRLHVGIDAFRAGVKQMFLG